MGFGHFKNKIPLARYIKNAGYVLAFCFYLEEVTPLDFLFKIL